MPTATKTAGVAPEITLKDVVIRLDALNQHMNARFDEQNKRFDEQNARIDSQTSRMDRQDITLKDLAVRMDKRFDEQSERMNNFDIKLNALNQQMDRKFDEQSKRIDYQSEMLQNAIIHMNYLNASVTTRIDGIENYMKGMEHRLSSRIFENTRAIVDLKAHVKTLDEDLHVTMFDTIAIRKHVGMYAGEEEE